MATTETIRDVLAADGTLTSLLTGGVYTFAQTGRNGISRASLPDAFDGFLRPCAVIKAGEIQSVPAIRDSVSGTKQTVEVYLYDDGDSDYATLVSARDRVIALLDRQWIEGAGWMQYVGGADDQRDPKLNGAAVIRADFTATT